MKNFRKNIDKRTWGVLGKQQTYYSPAKFLGEKVPLNANPLDSWDVKRSRFRRIDLVPKQNDGQQSGTIIGQEQQVPTVSPTPQPTPSVTPTSSPLPQDCVWNTTNELWENNTNLWNDCQDVPVASPTPSVTATATMTPTPSITPTITTSVTPTLTPTVTVTSTVTPTPSSTPSAFSPNQISNLQYWFDAASGSSVSSWTNYGSLGGSVTQAVATNQPQVKTNTVFGSWTGNSMEFITRDFMAGTFTNTNFSAATLFSIYRQVSRTLAGDHIGWRLWDGSANIFQQWLQKSSVPEGMTFNLPFSGRSYTGSTYVNQPLLTSIVTSGLTQGTAFIDMNINDSQQSMDYSAATAYLSATTVQFGTGGTNTNGNLQIVEFLVYNKVLNSTEFQQVEDYLKTKYQYNTW